MIVEKYKPGNLEDIKGQDVNRLRSYVLNRSKKPLLIYGPSGTGKTASVHALANELGYELFEVNASDARNKDAIESLVGGSLKQASLFGKSKIILFDELDGINGNADRGGIKTMLDLAENSVYPIIATMTDLDKLEEIKNKFLLLEFKKLDNNCITGILEDACRKESLKYEPSDLALISRIADGDARYALICLELSVHDGCVIKKHIDNISSLAKNNSDDALLKLFKSKNLGIVLHALNELDCDMVDMNKIGIKSVLFDNEDCFIYALEENLPYEYAHNDLSKSFDLLAKADIFRTRIYRWQHYRYLVYIQSILASVCLVKENKSIVNMAYRKTSRSPKNNKKLWWLVNKKKTNIAEKIAESSHMSRKKALKDFQYYKLILKDSRNGFLMEEEIEYLNH